MPISKKLITHLDKNKIKYDVVKHRTVFTAYDLANTLKRKLSEITKTLVVKTEKGYYLVVLPANFRLDLGKLKKLLQSKKIEIAKEKVMTTVFKVKAGAITPFGTLHKAGVVVDKALLKTQQAIFGAGSFTESLRFKIKDFLKLEKPQTGDFGKKFIPETIAKPKVAKKKAAKRKISKKKK